jgi:hypothetical protein
MKTLTKQRSCGIETNNEEEHPSLKKRTAVA